MQRGSFVLKEEEGKKMGRKCGGKAYEMGEGEKFSTSLD